ncbi:MAG: hypothetical protein ACLFQQ_14580 [Desulfococcaceae bacterium]
MPDFQIRIQGPTAEAAAQDLAAQIQTQFNHPAQPQKETAPPADGQKFDPSLALSAAAFVLSIPAAVLAAMDLKHRLAQKPKADALIHAAQTAPPENRLTITYPDGATLDLRTADANAIIEAAGALGE